MNVKQFEIWNVDLNPRNGSEQSGLRPCLVIETNAVQNKGKTIIVIPCTSQIQNIFSFDVILAANKKTGLIQKSKLKLRQVRVIDKQRLVKKLGKIEEKEVQQKILESLSLLFDFEQLFSI